MSKQECGCKLKVKSQLIMIAYCPLHKAALNMLIALRYIAGDRKKLKVQHYTKVANKAIAQAKGK